MDHDKFQKKSENEKKGISSADENVAVLMSGEECAGSNSEENKATRVLQPFFVADTLEDDESIIPPSQEDSELLIPSTPAHDSKSDKQTENVNLNESTISVLEETCVLETKTECNDSSKEDATTTACNESDMTQDLAELEPTQPIIPSNLRIEHSFIKEPNNANKSKVDEEEDDEWQLKFSETQTQEDLINYQKNDQHDEEPETQKILPAKDLELEDDDLPDTLSIEVPQKNNLIEDYYKKMDKTETKDNEVLDEQSDDEIEPSQSCLSEYKGETISASFKVPSVVDISNEYIPKLCSEQETINEKSDLDITMIDESEKRTISLSESEPKEIFNESKSIAENESLTNQEIPTEPKQHKNVEEETYPIKNVDEKRTKNCEYQVKQIVEKISVDCDISKESDLNICDEKDSKLSDSNGNEIDEIEVIDVEVSNKKIKPSKVTGKKDIKSKILESGANDLRIKNSEKHDIVLKQGNHNLVEENNSVNVEIPKNKIENNIEEIKINENEEKEQIVPNTVETNEVEIVDDRVTEEDKISKQDSVQKTKIQEPISQQKDIQQHMDVSKVTDSEVDKLAENVPKSESHKISCENLQSNTKHISDEKSETSLESFAKPSIPNRFSGSLKKQKSQGLDSEVSFFENREKKISSLIALEFLENFSKSLGMPISHEKLESQFSKVGEEIEFKVIFKPISNQEIIVKDCSLEREHHNQDSNTSNSNITTTTTTSSSKMSLHSGEMADNSSFSPGDMYPKTSTQKSSQKTDKLLETFEGKVLTEVSKTEIHVSPIAPEPTKKSTSSKRKRVKKNVQSSSSDASSSSEPKNKRAKGKTKARVKIVENINPESEESKETVSEEKPKKPTRRKKGTTSVPDIKLEKINLILENLESTTEDSSSFNEDANFGTILPGCKVMARWKDGYYYSGMVQSQESDGKWAVLFEDGLLRTISPECLIKIAILPKGSSVLVQSPDDFYDPGIVCGHFREDNKVGYEIELDNGVTKRFTRSAVILSNDQAKLIMKNAPPTTPASMTINLDNIVDGKRKRKSIQSPVAIQPVKKSPRITRSIKLDMNIDSTAGSGASSASDTVSDKSKTIEVDELPKKKQKTKKGTKAATATEVSSIPIPSTSSSNTSKVTKVLSHRSTKKLFKNYAFLLTNADRKIVNKPADTSDSDAMMKEEEDIVPFDKDELCDHIASGGGIVLDKFDDIKKCSRKYIYLLANSYLRTMKYIQSIAAGISCIKHHWVQNCIFKSEILDLKSYLLPAGYSIITQQVIEWHGSTDVFKNCKIALVSAPESPFVYTWAPVLLAAKADFVQKWSLPSSVPGCSAVVDVLITNNNCPVDIIQSAKKKKISIVSSEWIIQCLIMGKKLPYDAHPKFKYDYTEI